VSRPKFCPCGRGNSGKIREVAAIGVGRVCRPPPVRREHVEEQVGQFRVVAVLLERIAIGAPTRCRPRIRSHKSDDSGYSEELSRGCGPSFPGLWGDEIRQRKKSRLNQPGDDGDDRPESGTNLGIGGSGRELTKEIIQHVSHPVARVSGGGVQWGSIVSQPRASPAKPQEFSMSETAAPAQAAPPQEPTSRLWTASVVLVGMMGAARSTTAGGWPPRCACRSRRRYRESRRRLGCRSPTFSKPMASRIVRDGRDAGDRAAARQRPGRDRHRRGRLHARCDPQPHPRQAVSIGSAIVASIHEPRPSALLPSC